MSKMLEDPKCFVCGAGREGLTRHKGKLTASVCKFKEDMQCPQCKSEKCVFIHDDVLDSEVWLVCGKCNYLEHIG